MALTQKDIEVIEKIVNETVTEKIRHLPTKDEFNTRMDEVMGELYAIREELTVVNHRTSGHEDRIAKIEEIHPGGQHV